MPNPPKQPPILSLAERDRRWANVRTLMRERGFDGLLVAGFRAREMYETYISDDYNEGCVIFPLEGDPVVITWAYLRVMRARWSQERGTRLWVGDYRVATSGTGVAEVFREKKLAESSLGVVGLSSQAPTEIYGAIPANFWMELTTALPKARWQDISEEFSHLMLVKSDEELAQVRYAARAGAMEEPHREAGCWGYTPLVHSVGPHFLAGRTQVNLDQVDLGVRYAGANAARVRKAMLVPGMVFALEPNACIGTHRVNIGGTVIVTATGCEELNHIPTTVTHKQ